MKRLNILELHRKINERSEKKSVCYDKVLELCHKRIMSMTEKDKTSCIFDFPEYIVGLPLFDLNMCIEHVYKQLIIDGFCVRYQFPKALYISWNLEEIKHFKAEQRKQIPLRSILPQTQTFQTSQISQNSLSSNPIFSSLPPQVYQNQNLPTLHSNISNQQNDLIVPIQYNTVHIPQNSKTNDTKTNIQIQNNTSSLNTQTHTQNTIQNQIQNVVQGSFTVPIPLDIPERTFQSAPFQPLKYNPFDILIEPTSNINTTNKITHTNNNDTSAMKQMLVSNIGNNKKKIFDYKPSGKLTLNI
jgi:hypothetical protein